MKKIVLLIAIIGCLSISGCSGDSAKDIYETAQLEELQNNPDHAAELYRQILEKHPQSEYAAKAGERLNHLEQGIK